MKYFVKITTDIGTLTFPFMSVNGYSTRKEAEFVAREAMRTVPGIESAEVQEVSE